ncbi:MAG: hypothetical protein RLZZ84_1407 [Pseudomonadota bacterium]|jgi:hypothetical protein
MTKLDITKTNDAVDALLAVTTNPRHRFLLETYHRHRFLEMAGRYAEIFAPEMTVANPVYHFNALGITATLGGADSVEGLYGMWAESHQSIFYTEDEQVAVSDNFITSISTATQQTAGAALIANGIEVDDPDAMYLYRSRIMMTWPYDDECRLLGEDVWETEPDQRMITKLDPADVVTTEMAAELLNPLIRPQPVFDPAIHGRKAA